jgi:hypothetical protein
VGLTPITASVPVDSIETSLLAAAALYLQWEGGNLMANSLLDFVMSLVRDPEAAARYAENPDQAIHDANLTDVTSADVSNLIPVVSESLSTAVPTTGTDALIGDAAGNVWASGAATAAFDAFDDPGIAQVIDDAPTVLPDLVSSPDAALQPGLDVLADAGVPGVAGVDDTSLQFDTPVIDDMPVHELAGDTGWDDTLTEVADLDSNASGFDVF